MTDDEAECKHQMPRKWCATCDQPIKAMMPRRAPRLQSAEETSRKALSTAIPTRYGSQGGYIVIHTCRENAREDASFKALDDRTLFVHINGHPFVWSIAKILDLAPKLQVIEVIPPMLCKMGKKHLALCVERGVKVQAGHYRPEMAWDNGECRTPAYLANRSFFLGMDSEKKALFDELRRLGFEDAEIAARYFCLDGQEYMSQQKVSDEFGLCGNSIVSRKVLSVMAYLEPQFSPGQDAVRTAACIREKVKRVRDMTAAARWKENLLTELGIKDLPAGLPMSKLHLYAQLIKSREKIVTLSQADHGENRARALILRFGLDEERGKYRTLDEVGVIMTISRERARQLESKALDAIGVDLDDDDCLDDTEVARLLDENNGNAAAAARFLGVNEKMIQRARRRIKGAEDHEQPGPDRMLELLLDGPLDDLKCSLPTDAEGVAYAFVGMLHSVQKPESHFDGALFPSGQRGEHGLHDLLHLSFVKRRLDGFRCFCAQQPHRRGCLQQLARLDLLDCCLVGLDR